ncbi:hypothetical protein Y1Q_0010211 [Alligator mississippiensis]|uniref:Secreted protein n=1 Tax=Alligator mississippiensis TaxID=8496 RepID=A0A151NGK6_ALLMI|nr:hypothetical protein Y1Q_0010211 [Alligator mississippiensis]
MTGAVWLVKLFWCHGVIPCCSLGPVRLCQDKRVAMAIMKLAIHTSLHYTGNQFGVAPCMAGLVIHELCQLLQDVAALLPSMEVSPGRIEYVWDRCKPKSKSPPRAGLS